MTLITRRNIMGSTGLALAGAPFLLPKRSYAAFGQAAPINGPKESPISFSNDLAKYTQNSVETMIAAAKNGALSSSHLQRAASCTHLFARHLESLDIDKSFSALTTSFSYSQYLENAGNYQKQSLAYAQSFDPTIQLSDIPSSIMTQTGFEGLRDQASSLRLSGIYHSVADTYAAGRKHMDAGGYKPAVWNPDRHASLSLGSRQSAHLQRACLSAKQKKALCDNFNTASNVLNYTGAAMSGVAALCFFELIGGPVGAVLCGAELLASGALGLSIWLHGEALSQFMKMAGC